MCIVCVSVLSAEAAMSPIVPGWVRQASYPNRPCLLQQLWTSPHLSAALLLPLSSSNSCLSACTAAAANILTLQLLAQAIKMRREGVGLHFKRDPTMQRTKERNRERISDRRAELTGLLHRASQWPRKKTGSVLRGLSFSITLVISVGLSPVWLRWGKEKSLEIWINTGDTGPQLLVFIINWISGYFLSPVTSYFDVTVFKGKYSTCIVTSNIWESINNYDLIISYSLFLCFILHRMCTCRYRTFEESFVSFCRCSAGLWSWSHSSRSRRLQCFSTLCVFERMFLCL